MRSMIANTESKAAENRSPYRDTDRENESAAPAPVVAPVPAATPQPLPCTKENWIMWQIHMIYENL